MNIKLENNNEHNFLYNQFKNSPGKRKKGKPLLKKRRAEEKNKLKKVKNRIKKRISLINNLNLQNIQYKEQNIKLVIYKLIFIIYLLFLLFNKNKKMNNDVYNLLYDENIYDKQLNNIIKMKKVVYTVILGKYDKLKKIIKQEGWDYFAFVDPYDSQNKDTNWTILPITEEIKNLDIKTVKKQRFIKTHPHLFFQNYSLSIYIDATYSIIGDLNEFILRILTPNFNIYTLEHPDRNNLYQEIEEVVYERKEKRSKANYIKEKYLSENIPKETGLIESCIMIRRHNEKECIDIMEQWWNEIKDNSHRDQLSFNYVLWKMKKRIKYIAKKIQKNYFSVNIYHLFYRVYKDNH